MVKVTWKNIVGQARIKETLAKAINNNKLGHAYMFCGDAGVGKFPTALELGLALLCENQDEVPCLACESCRKVLHHAHPNFHMAMPVCLEKQHRGGSENSLNDEGWQFLHAECSARITDPYKIIEGANIPQIPVDWIREINRSIARGSIDARRNVAIICGIDLINKESANAMLKTLEEPPENTIIILTTERPFAVLPTLISRCQLLRFGYIGAEDMASALAKRLDTTPDDSRIAAAVACADGSLGKAMKLLEQPVDEFIHDARALFALCGESDWYVIAPKLEALIATRLELGRDYGAAERILLYVMYVVRDCFLQGLGITEKYIKSDHLQDTTSRALSLTDASAIGVECQKAIAAVRARGNVHLVLATWMMAVCDILNKKL